MHIPLKWIQSLHFWNRGFPCTLFWKHCCYHHHKLKMMTPPQTENDDTNRKLDKCKVQVLCTCPLQIVMSTRKMLQCRGGGPSKQQIVLIYVMAHKPWIAACRVCVCVLSVRAATVVTHAWSKLYMSWISGADFVQGPYLKQLQPTCMHTICE